MDPAVVASLIAAAAGLIAAIVQVAKLVGDHAWYRRWIEVLDHATNEEQRGIARERIQYYVEEFAVTDRTRRRRRSAVGIGVFLILTAFVFAAVSAWVFVIEVPLGGWVVAVVATATYGAGLYLIGWFPDQERDRARAALARQLSHESRSDRWQTWFRLRSRSPRS